MPDRACEPVPAPSTVPTTKAEIDAFLDDPPDRELACFTIEAMQLVKRRLAGEQGRALPSRGRGVGQTPFEDALPRIRVELIAFENPGEDREPSNA